jgi:hypothetical protein
MKPGFLNIGVGDDVTIKHLAEMIQERNWIRRADTLEYRQTRRYSAQINGCW